MYIDYFYWQYVAAPRWLTIFFWNLQRTLYQFFSVGFMLRTLAAHWRRDRVAWRGGSLGTLALTIAWNLISRAVGFVVRTSLLVAWGVAAVLLFFSTCLAFIFFMLWPLLVMVGLATGMVLIAIGS